MPDPAVGIPAPLCVTSWFPFVGRRDERQTLAELLPHLEQPRGTIALVRGEPGSGKTRLVRELANAAAEGDLLVLYGACDAVAGAPYQPFVELLNTLVERLDTTTLSASLGPNAGELRRLLPGLAARVGELPEPETADPDTRRHRLHLAVAELLTGVGSGHAVLLVLDDVHWADVPSLHLFRQLARTCARAPILLLATIRESEPDVRPGFLDALADVRRTEGLREVRLRGLVEDDVVELLHATTGAEQTPALVELAGELARLTSGNPFLLGELWRALIELGFVETSAGDVRLVRPLAELESPSGVCDVVGQRLARLSPEAVSLLETASVIGPEFDLEVLGRVSGLSVHTLGAPLELVLQCGMLVEVPGRPGLYRFAHELVRLTLYGRLTGLRRARLHLAVGEALESVEPLRAGQLAQLAHHFSVAAAVGGGERAITYHLRAATEAMESFAHQEAADHLTAALDLGIHDGRQRARVQFDLGSARYRAGRVRDALEAFGSAAAYARRQGDAELLAEAAVAFEDACFRPAIAQHDSVRLLDEAVSALAASGDTSSPLRARALAGLTRALAYQGNTDRAYRVWEEAVRVARTAGDRRALALALAHSYFQRGRIPRSDVLRMVHEAGEICRELGDLELVCHTLGLSTVPYLELFDLAGAWRQVGEMRSTAAQTRQPFIRYVAELLGSALALCGGRLAEAEEMALRSHSLIQQLDGSRSAVFGIQMFGVKRELDQLAELHPVLQRLADSPDSTAWTPGLIALLAEIGMHDKARALVDRLLPATGDHDVLDAIRLAGTTYLADACAVLQLPELATSLYRELSGLGGGIVRIGQLAACYGAADRYLGMLATVNRDYAKAEAHFERALALNQRMGAHTWTAHTAHQYARMLLRRKAAGDHERASELAALAGRLAERHGLVALARKLGALVSTSPAAGTGPDALSAREIDVLRLVAGGQSNREIGARLYISEHTVANHIRHILRKTGCTNRTDATSYAHRRGLTHDGRS
ncbi:helix-turn-helix transcriptional regulator [Flindersiella endophytica]